MCEPSFPDTKHNDVLTVRAPRVLFLLFFPGTILILFVGSFLTMPEVFGYRPLPEKLYWLRIFIFALPSILALGFISAWTNYIFLTPELIVLPGRFFKKCWIPISDIEKLDWGARQISINNTIVIHTKEGKRYPVNFISTYTNNLAVIRHLRKFIPLEKQVGWEEYYLRNRHFMTVPDKATRKKSKKPLVKLIFLAIGLSVLWLLITFGIIFILFFTKGSPEVAGMVFGFSLLGILIMNGLLFYMYFAKKRKEAEFLRELESEDYAEYAELPLPPELEE